MTPAQTQPTTADDHPSFILARALPEPWRSHFPKTMEEAQAFEPLVRRRCFGFKVLVVARTRRGQCAWSAYIDAVPGIDHDKEKNKVLLWGNKLPEAIARAMFPEFDGVRYAR